MQMGEGSPNGNKKARAKTRANRQRPRFTMAGIAIFGPGVLNFCVRDGNRCDHSGIVTRSFREIAP